MSDVGREVNQTRNHSLQFIICFNQLDFVGKKKIPESGPRNKVRKREKVEREGEEEKIESRSSGKIEER